MPKIHRYVDGRGYYIKTRIDGSIVTYQVTPDGARYLEGRGRRDGSTISTDELMRMQRKGYVYTGGGGPGVIEKDDPFIELKRAFEGNAGSDQPVQLLGACGCVVIFIVLVIGYLLAVYSGRQHVSSHDHL